MKSKPLINYIAGDGKYKDDFFGNLTICNVPDSCSESLCEQLCGLGIQAE